MAQSLTKDSTVKAAVPAFIDYLADKKRSPSTILAYRADLEQLTSYLTDRSVVTVSQVTRTNLDGFRDWLLSQKYTPKSTSRKLNAVKTFFRWLATNSVVTSDPSKDVEHPKIDSAKPKFLSPLEYRALRDVVRADRRIATIVELILQTGMRISEVANLKVEHITEEHIHIEAYATQPERKIPMNQAARLAIREFIESHRPKTQHPHVFVSRNGKPLATRNIRAAIDRYIQRAELPKYSVNDLRTTFIVENLKREVDIVTISQVAGHKRLSTTERYLEILGLKEAGKKQKLEEL